MHRDSLEGLKAIEHFASFNPESPALVSTDETVVTYAELWLLTTAVGGRLRKGGISAQETVAVLAPQGMLQVISVIGVLGYCACAVLQPQTVLDEVKSSLRRLSASALIVAPEFAEETEAALDAGLVVVIASPDRSPEEWQIKQPVDRQKPSLVASNTVLYQMTSGTTGGARIVPTSVASVNARAFPFFNTLKLTAFDRQLQMMSFYHGMAVFDTLAQFLAGGSTIVAGGFDPTSYCRWIEDLRPTWYACSPAVHKAALEQLKDRPPPFPTSLRFAMSTGAAFPQETKIALESILRIPLFNLYGMTEAGFIATDALTASSPVEGSAGRTYSSEIGIMSFSGELLPAGGEGEIVVRGPAVFSGYLDDEQASRSSFRNGWFRSGDAGRLDADGNLFVTGRLKEIINRGGEKVAPAEIDAVMVLHPAILDAAAFAIPHPTLGENVACAVVLRPTSKPSVGIGELRRFAAERLARFKVPGRIWFVDEIPRGELGKPQRWLLTERFANERSDPPSPAEVTKYATDDIISRSYEIWARILNRDDFGFDENFFDAGGDSLAAINMLAEIDQRLGSQTSASAASFLEEPTLVHLAELVGQASLPRPSQLESSEMHVISVREEGTGRRLFCIPADGEEGLYFRRLATHLRGRIDVSIVRPANTWYDESLFTFEHAGASAAKLIRQVQPKGPYFVGGFCYGGIVAAEAARKLVGDGEEAGLALFDVPMPGYPSPLRGWCSWAESARCQWQSRRLVDNANFALDPRYVARRMAWLALLPLRRILVFVEQVPIVKWSLHWLQRDYFPLYKPRPIDAPILHFIATDEPNIIDRTSRLGWRTVARRGIEEQLAAFDHANLLHESNLPKIVDALLRWCNA